MVVAVDDIVSVHVCVCRVRMCHNDVSHTIFYDEFLKTHELVCARCERLSLSSVSVWMCVGKRQKWARFFEFASK